MTSGDSERGDESPERRTESEATRDERDRRNRSDGTPEQPDEEDAPESMLKIAGHEDRERPGADPETEAETETESEAEAETEAATADADADAEAPSTAEDDGSVDLDSFYSGGSVEEVFAADDDDEDGEPTSEDEADARLDEVLPDDDAVAGTDDDEVEPVELLVQLAENGEIDPWDIDIVRVTDRFLDALGAVDLRTSGRALFYASVLLRMKGDVLIYGREEDEDDGPEPWEQPFGGDDGTPPEPGFDPVEGLEAEMERRLDRKHARGTPETLDELVRDLREAERGSWWKTHREYDTSDSPKGFRRGTQTLDYHSGDDRRVDDEPTESDVTGTTHEEDIEDVIDDVRAVLREHYDAGRTEVLYAEISESGGTRVETFLALLFLAHRGQVRLQQDELFGDLWVQDPSAVNASGEALAD
ncbi:segregation/condensation protein A [Haloarchaeobius sp. HRN-SO-5]|uniref:segregation/condensation protein A n=1 Tax=Haloarchaeobius sp. HRN-SO-5 TaxID=3446118 RepID=UPI003EBAF970